MNILASPLGYLLMLAGTFTQVLAVLPACGDCLQPIWHRSIQKYTGANDILCSSVSMDNVFKCLDTCDLTATGKPAAAKIKQLTQISDIFYALLENNCPLPAFENGTDAACASMAACVVSAANYDFENSTSHALYSTVFNYDCGNGNRNITSECIWRVGAECVSMDRVAKLDTIVSVGVEEACDEPRRCVKYGNIFEVKPGTNCTEYYQQSAVQGSTADVVSRVSRAGEGFNTAVCDSDHLYNDFYCPPDLEVNPSFIDKPTTTERPTTTGVLNDTSLYPEITVNTNVTCEQCLLPLWYRAVTTSGSHLCEHSFQEKVYECLANCQCCPTCTECAGRKDQYKTEILVKLADINKALATSRCGGNSKCSAASYGCTDLLAQFNPKSAPHVTVNTFSCGQSDLGAALQCFSSSCNTTEAGILRATSIAGFDPICASNLRCMTYGNIYEYVPVSDVLAAGGAVAPCAHFRRSPANDWHVSDHIQRVRADLLFNTKGCQPDWPAAVVCPAVISVPGLM